MSAAGTNGVPDGGEQYGKLVVGTASLQRAHDHRGQHTWQRAGADLLASKDDTTHNVLQPRPAVRLDAQGTVADSKDGRSGLPKQPALPPRLQGDSRHSGELVEDTGQPHARYGQLQHLLHRRRVGGVDEVGHPSESTNAGSMWEPSATLRTAVPEVKNSRVWAPHIHSFANHSTPVMPVA